MGRLVSFLVIVAASWPSWVAAQDETRLQNNVELEDEAARRLFDVASAHYHAGRFLDAAHEFEEAYRLSHRPALLFNAAVAYRDADQRADEQRTLRAYLESGAEIPNRARLEARLAMLDRSPAPGEGGPSGSAGGGTTVETSESPSALAIALVIGGGVVAVAGTILLTVGALDAASVTNAEMGTVWSDVADAYGRSEPLSIAGAVGIGVGVAALAAGVVLWFVAPDRSTPEQARRALTWSF